MRKFRTLTIPEKAHPLIRRLFVEMNKNRIGLIDVSKRAGISCNTIKAWRTQRTPNIADLAACYGVLGLELVPKERKDHAVE